VQVNVPQTSLPSAQALKLFCAQVVHVALHLSRWPGMPWVNPPKLVPCEKLFKSELVQSMSHQQ
jgi:hypothetical protein